MTSNKAAIGAKVRTKATINGNAVWQLREVSSQNSFNGHNMLNVHFGFGDATTIDSLIILWPLGMTEVFENLAVNNHYIVTEGQGIVVVGVDESDDFVPKEFQLSQNYPNPFNPTTKIRYSLPVSEFVTLKVHDILGREVTTLVNGEKGPGNHEVTFDGSRLASTGVYFYRMTAGNFSQIHKMVLIK